MDINNNLNLIENKFIKADYKDKKNINNFKDNSNIDNVNIVSINDGIVSNYNKIDKNIITLKENKIEKSGNSKDELKDELKKYLKKFNKKLIIKTFSKVPYGVAGYFTADKFVLKSLKYMAPVIEAVFAYKDYHHKIQEGKSKFSAAFETISSFVSGVGVSYLVGSSISGPLGFALSVSLGALAGVLADKLASKISSKISSHI